MSDQEFEDESAVMVPWAPPINDTWKDIIRPVTITQVLQAEASPFFGDRSLVIDGRGFAAVRLVAHVTGVEMHPAKASCTLEDGTGRIKAEKDLDSLGLSAEAEEEETTQYKALEHTYVEVTGFTIPKNDRMNWPTKIKVKSIHPVQDYYQVLHHMLCVIHSDILIQQNIQPYDPDSDFRPNEDTEVHMDVDDLEGQAYRDDSIIQQQTIHATASHAILPNSFSPQRHQPYATLPPFERAIMRYMHHHRNHHVPIAELAQAIQTSYGCTEDQLNLAVQALLSEAYITSPLDDGHVVITPRH